MPVLNCCLASPTLHGVVLRIVIVGAESFKRGKPCVAAVRRLESARTAARGNSVKIRRLLKQQSIICPVWLRPFVVGEALRSLRGCSLDADENPCKKRCR